MIETDRLLLRRFERSDLVAFAALLSDERTMAAFGGTYDADRAERELAYYLDHHERCGFAPFAVLLDGGLIGDVGLQHLEDGQDVELLYRLLPAAWGRGLATEAGDAALEYGFSELGLSEVVAVIAEDNAASQRLAARLGFVGGEPGTYYGEPLVRWSVSPGRHAQAVAARSADVAEE